jgi:hypothetical protein
MTKKAKQKPRSQSNKLAIKKRSLRQIQQSELGNVQGGRATSTRITVTQNHNQALRLR